MLSKREKKIKRGMNDKKTRDSMKICLNKKIYSSELNKHILIIIK
jgi:hypothetical protein